MISTSAINLGREHGGVGCHRYLRYVVSGRPMRRQSNALRTKGQLAASYSGYDSSATQLPLLYTSHDGTAAATGRRGLCRWCWEVVAFAAVVAAVQAARASRRTTVAESKSRRSILQPNR